METRAVQFQLTYTPTVALRLGCSHGLDFQDWCRCCEVNKAVTACGMHVGWADGPDPCSRMIFGTAEGTEQRRALAMLVAFVRADPDPLKILGADKALEKMR